MVARMVEDVEGFIVSSAAALGSGAGPPPCSRLLVRYTSCNTHAATCTCTCTCSAYVHVDVYMYVIFLRIIIVTIWLSLTWK